MGNQWEPLTVTPTCNCDCSSNLFERTVDRFEEIEGSVPVNDDDALRFLLPHQEEVRNELQKSPSVFFIGERNYGESSVINKVWFTG